MARIFICYRREDTAGHTGRLRDALSAEFGATEIFRDLDTIAPGDDFERAMSAGIASCVVFLAIVGRQWLTVQDRDGRRRLDHPGDHVRKEVAEALQRGVRVIPVLVQGASMPGAEELPDPLKTFASRNAIELDDQGWESDVKRLVEAIRRELRLPAADRIDVGRRRMLPWKVVLPLAAVALILAMILTPGRSGDPSSTDAPAPRSAPTSSTRTRTATPPSAERGSSGQATLPAGGASRQATLPAGGEAALGSLVYEVVDARVSAGSSSQSLDVRIRLTNRGRYDANFSASAFRLQVDGEQRAPETSLSEVVSSETTEEETLAFTLPPDAAATVLRVTNGDESAEIPFDLEGRRGLTASADRELRRSGKRTVPVSIDPAVARMRFGVLACEVRAASVHRYAHKLTLTLDVRAQNSGQGDVEFGDSHFRLILDDMSRAPVTRLSMVVPGEGSHDAPMVFDLPLDATAVVVRTRFGDITADVPLRIPPTR